MDLTLTTEPPYGSQPAPPVDDRHLAGPSGWGKSAWGVRGSNRQPEGI